MFQVKIPLSNLEDPELFIAQRIVESVSAYLIAIKEQS